MIPTRNRAVSLDRALAALAAQRRCPDEVIIVDASDAPVEEEALRERYPALRIVCVPALPALCAQRNEGIRRARGSHVLLLDDDVEPPPEYIEVLVRHLESHPEAGAVSGIVCEPDAAGGFKDGFPVPSASRVLFAFMFQLSVFGDLEAVRPTWFTALPLALAKRWYRRRGNTWSLAGWPLITQVRGPLVRVELFVLSAALVSRSWLLESPYDERFGPHGVGDNYGVALGFPEGGGVSVLTSLRVPHHRADENRRDPVEAYVERVLALHCFMAESERFSVLNTWALLWSLMGNVLAFAIRGRRRLLAGTLRAMALITSGRNPLLRAT